MTEPKYRRRVLEPLVPKHFADWFAGMASEPLEYLCDGASARIARIYRAWQNEDPGRRRQNFVRFLRRVDGWDVGR